jgi:AcrR family transcriptional regulator
MLEPSKSTRERLLFAAERLFAEYGVDGVSLRQVNAEAGQRNSSAAHYHFGSKEALIEAIYKNRMEQVNLRRSLMVEELIAADKQRDLRTLVAAIVLPIAEQIYETEGGLSYVRFVAQIHGRPRTDIIVYAREGVAQSLDWVNTQVRETLSHIPPVLLNPRIGFMFSLIYATLAHRENMKSLPGIKVSQNTDLFVNNLIDSLVGSLSAPISKETSSALNNS